MYRYLSIFLTLLFYTGEALSSFQEDYEAASHNDIVAQGKVLQAYNARAEDFKNPKQAFNKYLSKSISQENMGQIILAWMYKDGFGVENNTQLALKLLQQSAQAGYVIAQRHLAWEYKVMGNGQEALKWYKEAALQGDTVSQIMVGRILRSHQKLSHLFSEDFAYFKAAAHAGDSGAQFYIALRYEEGKNQYKAFKWFQKAANQGHIGALCKIEQYQHD